VKLIFVQCHAEARRDSKGDTVDAGRRVVAELRTGGRLAFFATGGRLVERERPEEVPLLLDEREVVEREALDRDDDDVPCERVPRCEFSCPVMAIPPLRLSCDQIHQVAIQYEQQRQSQPCLLLPQLLLQRLPEYLPREWENSERAP
jgi:ferredoxin